MSAPICRDLKCFGDISAREQHMKHGVIGKLLGVAVEDKSVISLGPGEPDFSTPQPILNYGARLLASGRSTHYSPPSGRKELKEAIIQKLRRDNKIRARPENIIVTSGSQEALMMSLITTMDPHENIILPSPSYMGYEPAVEFLSGRVRQIPLRQENNFDLDVDLIKRAVNSKTRGIIFCNPSNPTGMIYPKKTLERLADVAVDKGLFIYSDEAYEKIVYDKKPCSFGSLNGMKDYSITLQSFSKSYAMCGFRLGYAVAPKRIAEAMSHVHVNTTISAPTISQMMGTYALKTSESHTFRMVREYDRRRRMIVKRLNGMGLKTLMPQGAFYAFSNISHLTKDSNKFAEQLLKKAKVAVIPGAEFGKYGEGFLRLSYATDYRKIETAMNKIERFVK
ncbi:pyridoxal phosphate-dependent aminotransferase [Candidatus Woesearchaeota archaeon]|jgi:aminotransferase|nr:pyridoxal phosphate-dependent aminotransferase [Candidatus Woesearchaeota archaeon]MBT5274574.1 pyridoxal phosphate-dependent aminotransferase [Candidatus Woesearchaeota archaeon]MBT6023127.1 pyridoxal phosphate-dependent aminotransferase [Candidatus Woesearchaeota archaeon]